MKNIYKDLLDPGINVGDIITLSDFQTQAQYSTLTTDFKIKEIREFKEQNGIFHIKCYILDGPNGNTPYMVMVKQVGTAYDVFVYYLDTDGELYEAKDGQEVCPFYALLTPDLKDLSDRIEVTVNYGSESLDVTWDKQGSSSTVKYSDSTGLTGLNTVADYFTNDECKGNNRCFVTWAGSTSQGLVEVWYGCIIEKHEIEIYKLN